MKPASTVPERVAIIGNLGTGKTDAWVAWAKWLRDTDTPGTIYVLNCERDGSVQRSNERFGDWQSNVTHTDVNSWTELTAATTLYTSVAAEGDLIVIDGSDKPWEWVRDLYIETENRKLGHLPDPSDPFGTIPDYEIDGQAYNKVLNPAYFRWFNSLIMGVQPAHLMCVGPSQPLKVQTERSAWGDTKEALDLFSRFGVRWAGQKRLGFDVQTLLLAEVNSKGDHTLSTMKDAGGRKYLDREPIPELGFVTSYLVPCASWVL